ncbi:unnamed protein product, partial [Polarella glacialis]
SGPSWTEFNAIDFSKTERLNSGEKSDVKALARAIGNEISRKGGVALHAYLDSRPAVSTALKALASVPVEHSGKRVSFVPSLGLAKDPDGKPVGSLRLYVRPRSAAR